MPKILILGISHVRALATALTEAEVPLIQAVNLRNFPTAFDRKGTRFLGVEGTWPDPDLVLLTVPGNCGASVG